MCETAIGDPEEKVSDEKHRIAIAIEKEALSFPNEEGNFRR